MVSDIGDPLAEYPQRPARSSDARPSHEDRRRITDQLYRAVDEGRLDLDELGQRLLATERATSLDELQALVADLPATPATHAQPAARPVAVQPATPPVEMRILAQIGEITVTPQVIYTPHGPIPLRGSQWQVRDQWLVKQSTPSWAIVLAVTGAALGVLLALCTFFISLVLMLCLLFLLAKESRYEGAVDVAVFNHGRHYVARLPVGAQQQVHHIYHQVNYVRSLASG